jgi:DNA-binding NtrC family response regulator
MIAATHQDLSVLIEQGRFREDLYYRLNVLPIEVPALRDRVDDIPLLIHHFLDLARQERSSRIEGVSDEAMQRLMDYHWPGNVRELENLTERLTILVGVGDIDVEDLPDHIRAEPTIQPWAPRIPSKGIDFNAVVGRFESDLIEQALEHTHWNKNRAAGLLGLNRTTLIEKIKKRGITPAEDED